MRQRWEDVEALEKEGTRWDFLSIDSSDDVWNNGNYWSAFGESLELEEVQKIKLHPLALAEQLDHLTLQGEIAPWIGDEEILREYIGNNAGTPGANQRRRFGRLLFAANAPRIMGDIQSKVYAMQLSRTERCWFHIFATIGGGTGSGCVVDLANSLRLMYDKPGSSDGNPIFAQVFCTAMEPENATINTYFFQNQYSTLRDLNALMTGRFQPPVMVKGSNPGRGLVKTPLNAVSLFTHVNSRGRPLSLTNQVAMAAEACFERIFAFDTRRLGEGGQKIISFEDIGSIYGEPARMEERSYRFGGMGMRRWELPNGVIRELVALDILISSLRQMLYSHWKPAEGYLHTRAPVGALQYERMYAQLVTIAESVGAKRLAGDGIRTDHQRTLGEFVDGIVAERKGIKELEDSLAAFGKSLAGGNGYDTAFAKLAQNRKRDIGNAIDRIDAGLTQLWQDEPIGLRHATDLLQNLMVEFQGRAKAVPGSHSDDVSSRLAKRKLEFQKITFLSYKIKAREILTSHANDLDRDFSQSISAREGEEDRFRNQAIQDAVRILQARYESVATTLKGLLRKAEEERDAILVEVNAMPRPDGANKYEIDLDHLEGFRTAVQLDGERLPGICSGLRDLVATKEDNATLGQLKVSANAPKQEQQLDRALRRLALENVEVMHQALAERGLQPVLFDSLMARLEQRLGGGNTALLGKEAKEFVELAASCFAERKGETQPRDILGATAVGNSTMPMKMMVIGLPDHRFSEKLQTAFRQSLMGGDKRHIQFYTHRDPLQLRTFVADYWMAARFAEITHFLAKSYSDVDGGENDALKYFSNLDPEGEADQRPGLREPSPESQRLRLAAAVWLAKKLDPPGLQADPQGKAILVVTGDKGMDPIDLEIPLAELERKAGRVTMGKVLPAIAQRLKQLDDGEIRELRTSVEAEEAQMAKDFLVASAEYQRWAKLRGQLYEMLDQ